MELRDRLQSSLGSAYTIERELGGGAMSRVFVAEDTALARRVVIKVLSPELAAGVNTDRFKREILLAAGLQHPHIVPVLTAGEIEGMPYFTMPFVAGSALRARLDGGKGLPIAEALGILRDVAKALAYAHGFGIVHRDIKPDNVLLTGGSAAVTDFGIAKAISSSRATTERGELLTQVGSSIGTPAYMAPEQAAADPNADHRSDIYSFGVMAYELLTGHPPFHGRSPQSLLTAHLIEPPPPIDPSAIVAPPALTDLVMRCLAKNPSDRPQSADEIVQALDRVDLSGDWPSPRTRASTGRRRLAIAAAVAVALIAGGAGLWRWRSASAATPDAHVVAVVPFRIASADRSLHYLREGMLDLLAAKLTGEGGLRAMEPRALLDAWRGAAGSDTRDLTSDQATDLARQLGAGRLLLGDVVGTPTRLILNASLLGVPDGSQLARVSVEGAPDSLAWLVDRLAAQLLAATSSEGEARSSGLTSTSLPALRAYLDGQAKLRRGEAPAAARDFERSLAADSNFALAGLGLRLAVSWYGDQVLSQRGLQIAWREREQLSDRDRALLAAVAGPRYPDPSSAQDLLAARQHYLGLVPERAEAWYLLGDHLFHYGRVLGLGDSRERALDAFTRASERDSTYVPAMIHALPLAVTLDDSARIARFERLRLAADTTRGWTATHRWQLAQRRGNSATARAVLDSVQADPRVQGLQFLIIQHALYDGYAAADARRLLGEALEKAASDGERRGLRNTMRDLNLVLGRPSEALAAGRAAVDSANDVNLLVQNVRDAMVGDGDTTVALAAARKLEALEAEPASTDTIRRALQRAATRVLEPWRLSRGDTSRARRSIERLRTLARPGTAQSVEVQTEVAVVEAMLADVSRSPNLQAATNRLDSLLRATEYGGTHVGRAAMHNLIAARLYEKLGDLPRALAAARRRIEWNSTQIPYLATQLREEGRLAALAGEVEEAIDSYRQYLALRYDVEPQLRPQVEEVRAELARLQKLSAGK